MNEDTTYIETYTESDSGITDAMIEEYEIQDSIFCANQQPSDTVFDNTNDFFLGISQSNSTTRINVDHASQDIQFLTNNGSGFITSDGNIFYINSSGSLTLTQLSGSESGNELITTSSINTNKTSIETNSDNLSTVSQTALEASINSEVNKDSVDDIIGAYQPLRSLLYTTSIVDAVLYRESVGKTNINITAITEKINEILAKVEELSYVSDLSTTDISSDTITIINSENDPNDSTLLDPSF